MGSDDGNLDGMLITEALHLLLLKDDGAIETLPLYREYFAKAALLVDLVVEGTITVISGEPAQIILDPTSSILRNPILEHGRSMLRVGDTVEGVLQRPEFDPLKVVEESLIAAGVLERRSHGLLFRVERTPIIDAGPKRMLISRLRDVLTARREALPTDIALLVLLNGAADAPRILRSEADGLSREQFAERMRKLASGLPIAHAATAASASAAVNAAVTAAVLTAVLVPTVVGAII